MRPPGSPRRGRDPEGLDSLVMGDLFDDFMRELERRRAEAEGRAPRRGPGTPAPDDDTEGGDADGEGAEDDVTNDAGTDAT